jgi:large subunit ribosomal protein L9
MKVVLLRDVARIGKRHEVKEVPDGHALNMLIPKKLALSATSENLKKVAALRTKQASDAALTVTHFEDALRILNEKPLEIRVEANAQGHLFKGVKIDDIVNAAKVQGVHLAQDQIDLKHPIKEIGEHQLHLKSGERSGACIVAIIAK